MLSRRLVFAVGSAVVLVGVSVQMFVFPRAPRLPSGASDVVEDVAVGRSRSPLLPSGTELLPRGAHFMVEPIAPVREVVTDTPTPGMTDRVVRLLERHGEQPDAFIEYVRHSAETARVVLPLRSHHMYEALRRYRFSVARFVDEDLRARISMSDAERDEVVTVLAGFCDEMVAWRREQWTTRVSAARFSAPYVEPSFSEKTERDRAIRAIWLELERRYGDEARRANTKLCELLGASEVVVPPPVDGT